MARLLLNLRHVPDDEAADVHALLADAGIAAYDTPPSLWGISAGGIFVRDDAQLQKARALLADYQQRRGETARAEQAAAVREGRADTFAATWRRDPWGVAWRVAAALLLVGLMALPAVLLHA